MQIFLLIVIILLAGYIIYLHLQLVGKNILIESIVKKISGIEKNLNTEEIKKFISELHKYNLKAAIEEDRLFEEKTLRFIFENKNNARVYIHYTMDENVARTIMIEGFKFSDTFHKTALQVSNDKLDLIIKHNNKKYYGDFIIVISISDDIVKHYSAEMDASGIRNYSFENILSEIPSESDKNSDNFFLLPAQYVKGYVNYRTGEIYSNPVFQPGYSSPRFSENIARLKDKMNQNHI